MIIYLLIAAGIASVPAWRALNVLLQQIPHRNDDFDLSLLGSDGTDAVVAPASTPDSGRPVADTVAA